MADDTYTKLVRSITTSSIVCEPCATRWVWVHLLASCDRCGQVRSSLPVLAMGANVTLAEAEAAIAYLLAPDPHSRSQEHEGRRIEVIPGGWRLLNHAFFAAQRSKAARNDYMREHMRSKRGAAKAAQPQADLLAGLLAPVSSVLAPVSTSLALLAHKSKSKSLKAKSKALLLDSEKSESSAPDSAMAGFADFWAAYPKKVGKAEAAKLWASKALASVGATILADVIKRAASDRKWLDGYVMDPARYLRNERWHDEIEKSTKGVAIENSSRTGGGVAGRAEAEGNAAIERLKRVASFDPDARDDF